MHWVDKMNERANLMGRMLETIGAMERMPTGQCLGHDLRTAVSRCSQCETTEACKTWLDKNKAGATEPMAECPNSELFRRWLNPVF
ncbi:DUF6455 family protein [Roseibium suaedae]|uniref:DUF6455 domain-containing protein n=1 Tax=Roseibium suaedae TaxID=735517 RepID=A0A1M7FGA6_9HYPH|nr:DUF6455 family protein [Roseibium suaedae]SHM03003.1 hypothetical protein SAMN05444272_1603 [Roseibium suaedae]